MTTNQKKKILVVEDEKVLRSALKDALEYADFTAFTANDGEQGIETALKNEPDLILLDIFMPKMNGVSMLKKMRQNAWGKKVPVILLTNDSNPDHMRQTLKDNATDYLIKA